MIGFVTPLKTKNISDSFWAAPGSATPARRSSLALLRAHAKAMDIGAFKEHAPAASTSESAYDLQGLSAISLPRLPH
jgi:hypothetical protein